jgi:hypothetical protein
VDGEVRPATGLPLPSPWRRAEGGAVSGGEDGQHARDWRGNTCEFWWEVAVVSMGGDGGFVGVGCGVHNGGGGIRGREDRGGRRRIQARVDRRWLRRLR